MISDENRLREKLAKTGGFYPTGNNANNKERERERNIGEKVFVTTCVQCLLQRDVQSLLQRNVQCLLHKSGQDINTFILPDIHFFSVDSLAAVQFSWLPHN